MGSNSGGLEKRHGQQKSQIFLLDPHQDVTKKRSKICDHILVAYLCKVAPMAKFKCAALHNSVNIRYR